MENLETRWQQLYLSNEEDHSIIVHIVQLTKEINRRKTSIIGRLHVERVISKEIIRSSMMKIWKTTCPCSIFYIQPNTFIFFFDSVEDLNG